MNCQRVVSPKSREVSVREEGNSPTLLRGQGRQGLQSDHWTAYVLKNKETYTQISETNFHIRKLGESQESYTSEVF